MCMFCAAIPATLAVGTNLKTKQLRERRENDDRLETALRKKQVPVGKITIIAVGALLTASVVYHSRLNG